MKKNLSRQRGFVDFETVVGVVLFEIVALFVLGAVIIWNAPHLHASGMICAARVVGVALIGLAVAIALKLRRYL